MPSNFEIQMGLAIVGYPAIAAGIGVLAAMTIFTIRRDAATDAVKSAARGLEDWE